MQFKEKLTKEFLTEELINKKISIRELARRENCSTVTMLSYCKKTGMYNDLKKSEIQNRPKDLTGKKFGNLTVKYKGDSDRFNKARWICECECGKEKLINSSSLLRGLTKTCGWCDRINFKGYEEISGSFWRKLKEKANNHYNGFFITPEFIWELYLKQDKKCALSGVSIFFKKEESGKILQTASIDRIDSNGGYTEDNIQIVHKRVNRIKAVLNNQEFISWCKLIYLKHKQEADSLNIDLESIGWNDR